MKEAHLGKKLSEETRKKMRLAKIGNKNCLGHYNTLGKQGEWHFSEETKKKMSSSRMGQKLFLGKHHSEKTKEKMRKATIEYIKKTAGGFFPRLGYHEKQILDELEQKLNHKIIRQFEVGGFYIDGYIPETKLAIEIDEYPKNKERDISREIFIKEKLSCDFLRIKDYD